MPDRDLEGAKADQQLVEARIGVRAITATWIAIVKMKHCSSVHRDQGRQMIVYQ
jgi:hypothetical protein